MAVYSSPEVSGVTLLLKYPFDTDTTTALNDAGERLKARIADVVEASGRAVRDVKIEIRFY